MKRRIAYLLAVVGIVGVMHLAGPSVAQQPGKPAATPRPTVVMFNMAAVMRDFEKAKYMVAKLNKKRTALSGDLMKWRAEYIETQKFEKEAVDPEEKEEFNKKLLDLARRIEDRDREINKILNDEASNIISSLYDEMYSIVDKLAETNGYQIVLAYPDAVTPEEKKNPFLKELKLKPLAAQPFYVSPQVDITKAVVTTLNTQYPAPSEPDKKVD